MNNQLITGFALLIIGVIMTISEYTRPISYFIIGFSLPTIIRGANKND